MKPAAVIGQRGARRDRRPSMRSQRAEKGTIAGAAIDVFATEPLPADAKIRTAPRTVLTPHIAGSTPKPDQRRGGRGRGRSSTSRR